tara:strand:+ start:7581 stop:8441 length:861 start_codon:yes stop_codon:yes gene_type:complete
MTAYADFSCKGKNADYQVRIRSLNSRFLDLKISLPSELTVLEEEARALVAKAFHRGKVDLQVYRYARDGDKNVRIEVNQDLIQKAHQSLKSIAQKTGLRYESIQDLQASLPLLSLQSETALAQSEKAQVMKAMKACLDLAKQQRAKEGLHHARILESLVKAIEKELGQIERKKAQIAQSGYKRLEARLKKWKLKDIEPERLEQELVLYLDRSDINEELVRLREHLKTFLEVMKKNKSGKKLDFYTQEFLRETNTIGSKAQDAKITKSVVNMKCLIEQIRELVQNIE